MTDGRELRERSGEMLKGFPQVPLTREELATKYRECAQLVLSAEDVERSLKLIESLEDVGDITELMEIAIQRTTS